MLLENVFGVNFMDEVLIPSHKMISMVGNLEFVYSEDCFNKDNSLNKRIKSSVKRLKGLLILKESEYVGSVKEELIHDMELRKAISKELIYLKSKGVSVRVMSSNKKVA